MKLCLSLLLCLVSSLLLALDGLNLPALTPTADMRPGLEFARSKSLEFARVDAALTDATMAFGELRLEHYRRFGELCRETGRVPLLDLRTAHGNHAYWRQQLYPKDSPEDVALWNHWKSLEAQGILQDWNSYAGIDIRLWESVIRAWVAIVMAVADGYGSFDFYVQLENEPGNCKNGRLWAGWPYGWVQPAFRSWIALLRPRIAALGVKTIAPQWEWETPAGALEQIFSGRSPETPKFDFEAVGIYEPWQPSDTPASWAARKNANWRAVYLAWRPHRPVIFTESGGNGIPAGSRDACRIAENKLSWPGVAHRVWFSFAEPGHELATIQCGNYHGFLRNGYLVQ